MAALQLDAHGERVLTSWFSTGPSFVEIDAVEEMLACYARGEKIGDRWHTARDLATEDLIVHPTPNVQVIIRRFSEDDPETQFTVIAVQDVPEDEVELWA